MYVEELPFIDPVRAFAPFAEDPVALLLDGNAPGDARNRYAYLCVSPAKTLLAWPDRIELDGQQPDDPCLTPFDLLEQELAAFDGPSNPDLPPFQGGAAGLLGYELGRHLERLPQAKADGRDLPELAVGFYDLVVAFDLEAHRLWVISCGYPERNPDARQQRAVARAAWLKARLSSTLPLADVSWTEKAQWRLERSRQDYEAAIAKVIDYIFAGDIFQANLSQRFLAQKPQGLSDFDLYRRLRMTSAAPFAAFARCGTGLSVLSASPERFLALDAQGRIETRPIKGTRPRGKSPAEDKDLAAELYSSPKDRSENLMIVDLMRNDLSRVAEVGSVKVPALCDLESFATVHHLVSVVEGKLRQEASSVDLLRAAFPGGSITGAPKIRAMEIIQELEEAQRGPYCGSLFWLGFNGVMDSSILIRTLVVTDEQVVAQAGGGIVADSSPQEEYEETLTKARAMLEALDPDCKEGRTWSKALKWPSKNNKSISLAG
ncbi:aminodeoxychorismate synthase component I [Rhodovibrionaceae bacterium A322]